jgi:hypothetical protein
LFLESMGVFTPGASGRYCLSLSVILFGVVPSTERKIWIAIAWGLWLAYVLVQEFSQVLYAAQGAALIVAGGLWTATTKEQRLERIRSAFIAAAIFALVTFAYVMSLARHGQLAQWWEFVSTLSVVSYYSAWAPANISAWFSRLGTVEQFLVFLTLLTLVGGALQAAWNRCRSVELLLPLAIGCLSLMLLQKQIMRPGIAGQLLPIPVFGLAILVIQQLRLRPAPRLYATWAAFAATAIVTCFALTLPTTRTNVLAHVDVVSDFARDLRFTVDASARWSAARDHYFSPSSVALSQIPGPKIAARVRALTGFKDRDNVFVLGDNSDLYLILRRPAAFCPNFYNQSPLAGQERTMTWLRDRDPRYLLWDPQETAFDDIPNPVRVPLLYNYATAQFVPLGSVGKVEVLRRRAPVERPAVASWRDKLGTSLNLGYIPAVSRALSAVNARGGYRARYLIARPSAPEEGAVYSIVLRLAGEPYTVEFKGGKGVAEYPIAIDRLPFAAAGDEMGETPDVESFANGQATITTLQFAAERLY